MSTPGADQFQAQAMDFAKQGQAALTSLSENWASAMRSMTGGAAGGGMPGLEAMPNPAELVDRAFDVGVQILEAQRAFAHSILDAGPMGALGSTGRTR